MNILEHLNGFTICTEDNFPIEDCKIKNKYHNFILDSNNKYVCIVENIEGLHNNIDYAINEMYPFIVLLDNDKTYYGWFKGEAFYRDEIDNLYNNGNSNRKEKVIAFKKL